MKKSYCCGTAKARGTAKTASRDGRTSISRTKASKRPSKPENCSAEGFRFGKAYTSYLKRAVRTLNCVLDRLDQEWIPVEKNWRLNEKHYGVLQGLNKSETAARFGEEQVHIWRRSYDVAPDPLAEDDPRNPRFDPRYAGILTRSCPAPNRSSKPSNGRCPTGNA